MFACHERDQFSILKKLSSYSFTLNLGFKNKSITAVTGMFSFCLIHFESSCTIKYLSGEQTACLLLHFSGEGGRIFFIIITMWIWFSGYRKMLKRYFCFYMNITKSFHEKIIDTERNFFSS